MHLVKHIAWACVIAIYFTAKNPAGIQHKDWTGILREGCRIEEKFFMYSFPRMGCNIG